MINPFSRWIEREQKHTITMCVGLPGYYFKLTNLLTLLLNLLGPKAWTNHQPFLPPTKNNGAVSGWWSPSVGRKDLQKNARFFKSWPRERTHKWSLKGAENVTSICTKSIQVTNWRSREHRNPRGEKTKLMQVPFPETTVVPKKMEVLSVPYFGLFCRWGFPFHKP